MKYFSIHTYVTFLATINSKQCSPFCFRSFLLFASCTLHTLSLVLVTFLWKWLSCSFIYMHDNPKLFICRGSANSRPVTNKTLNPRNCHPLKSFIHDSFILFFNDQLLQVCTVKHNYNINTYNSFSLPFLLAASVLKLYSCILKHWLFHFCSVCVFLILFSVWQHHWSLCSLASLACVK